MALNILKELELEGNIENVEDIHKIIESLKLALQILKHM